MVAASRVEGERKGKEGALICATSLHQLRFHVALLISCGNVRWSSVCHGCVFVIETDDKEQKKKV